jgi:beta-galactosidase
MTTRALVSALALSLAVMTPPVVFAKPAVSADAQSPARQIIDLSKDWRFRYGSEDTKITEGGFDDSGWDKVDVPHTWNRMGEYALERSSATNNKQGTGWYRLTMNAPAASKGQRQYLDFAGVGIIADVWVNGVHVGQHKGAYSRFRLDVTAQWKPGAANLVVVKADNSKPTKDNSTSETLPLSGDFFVYGGLYRGVSLITADSASIDLMDFGGPGVYASAGNITDASADVSVLTRLSNAGTKRRNLVAVTTLADASGQAVASVSSPVVLAAGKSEIKQALKVEKPHLWNGLDDPYLYSVTVELRDGNRTIDKVTQPLGIRSFRIDANEGFFLNGKYLDLVGASRHQDRQGEGYALSNADHAEDMAIMKDMGANTVRGAHYQHADEWYAEADKAGMMVWAEIPFVNGPALDGTEGTPGVFANAEQQVHELIRQNYNHPSIFTWSVGNETDAAALFIHRGKLAKPLRLLTHLNQLAKSEDPTRLTSFADCCEDTVFASKGAQELAGTTDIIGYNRYYGWYYTAAPDIEKTVGTEFDKLHAKHPNLPLSISEYGAGGALSQHSDNVFAASSQSNLRAHPEEYQSLYHEENWKALKSRKYIFAKWIWNLFDFASDMRNEGDAVDLNDKGLVTYDRKTKKDAFYFYRANWSKAATLHINSKGYADRAYPVIDVRVYSNADKARLTLNGVDKGEAPCPDRICVWEKVSLSPGSNSVVVSATINGQAISDTANWNAPDLTKAGLHIDAGTLIGQVVGGVRYGSDTYFSGGTPMVLNGAMMGPTPAKLRKVEGDTPEVYSAWRQGEALSYAIPLPDGKWQVTISTFEPSKFNGKTTKVSILANGKEALKPYNVYTEAGGDMKGLKKTFPVTVKGGVLKLDFKATEGLAIIAAIDITK